MGSSEKHYQPFDRLTMIADDVSAFIKDHPLYEDGDKGMLCLNDTAKGGICLFGYEGDEREGVIDAFRFLRGICDAYNLDMTILPVNRG